MGEKMELSHAIGSNIVSLFRGKPQLSFPAIAQVDAYWEGLRDGRLMPERAEVDPRGLESALEFAFILEHIAPGVGRIRVAGMHMSDLLGMEVRGMPITAMLAPESRSRFSQVLEAVVNKPQVADITLSSPHGIGRPALTARLYLAPLGSVDGGTPRVLGCLQSQGGIGRTPRRFIVDQVQVRRIVGASSPTSETPKHSIPQDHVQHGFAEAQAAFSHLKPPSVNRQDDKGPQNDKGPEQSAPALRLVKTCD
jgi:hypothetical protein